MARRDIIQVCEEPSRSVWNYILSEPTEVEQLGFTFFPINNTKALPVSCRNGCPDFRSANQDVFLHENGHVIWRQSPSEWYRQTRCPGYVIHYDIPKSQKAIIRETGRAPDDGGEGTAQVLFQERTFPSEKADFRPNRLRSRK